MDVDVLLRQVNELAVWRATAEQRLAELERRHGEHAEAIEELARTVASKAQPKEPPQAKPPSGASRPAKE